MLSKLSKSYSACASVQVFRFGAITFNLWLLVAMVLSRFFYRCRTSLGAHTELQQSANSAIRSV